MSQTPCDRCRFCVEQDEGYSNYTVEGVTIRCSKGLHPDGHFDRWYGEDKRLRIVVCSGYAEGAPLWMDVEGHNVSELTPEEREVYDLLQSSD